MHSVSYSGFKIYPASYLLPVSGKWKPRVVITKHYDSRNETLEKSFAGKVTFKTRKDADNHAIDHGKQIIDRKCTGLTIDDLLR
jgi:hypothetical protein